MKRDDIIVTQGFTVKLHLLTIYVQKPCNTDFESYCLLRLCARKQVTTMGAKPRAAWQFFEFFFRKK